jgi:predicted Abi (CAAX) family protease
MKRWGKGDRRFKYPFNRRFKYPFKHPSNRLFRGFLLLVLTLGILLLWAFSTPAFESQYQITGRAPFNQIEHYPLQQTLPQDRYRPTGTWVGRLILPPKQASDLGSQTDWVWLEVYHAPEMHRDLQGQRVRLEWSSANAVQQYVAAVTREVKFTEAIAISQQKGNLHPERLNGRIVGPLQSIAGAHPVDDVVVSLDEAAVIQEPGNPSRLQIESDPIVTTGRFYGLVKILAPVTDRPRSPLPTDCPGPKPCPSELFQVQHYNAATGQFNGATEIIRIPQQPRDSFGLFASTPRDLEKSPVSAAGWYIYGAQDRTGLFTVQALKPRTLFQLQPQKVITRKAQGLDYIHYDNWRDTEQRRGTLETVLIDATANPKVFQLRDRALVLHLFGGRGGQNGEAPVLGTVTGHFSYGLAQVVREPLANELQWQVRYQQVYATNVEGVVSGTNDWTAYMGDLRRGWLGTRPVSDVLVILELLEDYDFGGDRISPVQELSRQLQVINARYRVGDGNGAALVTPATSCVQDSNQALFATVQQVRKTVADSPAIQTWLASHPEDPTTLRFQRLVAFGDAVENQLMPLGIVREDWRSNSEALSGMEIRAHTFRHTQAQGSANLLAALTSWRTILPRQTQDELSLLLLKNNARLWFLRTNQVGGNNPDIFPTAPTKAFGRWEIPGTTVPVVAVVLTRVLGAINLPGLQDWWVAIAALLGYGAISLPLGLHQGFLQYQAWKASRTAYSQLALKLFFLPALLEELVFRVLLLPAPQSTTGQMWGGWAIASLALFVIYFPVNARTLYKPGNPVFCDRRFLLLATLLGITCILTYRLTSSLLLITLIHWMVVFVWLVQLGGMAKLQRLDQTPTILGSIPD